MRLKLLLAALLLLPSSAFAQKLMGEQLYVLPPQGWVLAFHDRQGNVDLTEMVPQGQTMAEWNEMLMVQMIEGKPNQTPEDVLKNQQTQIKEACEDSGFGPVGPSQELLLSTGFLLKRLGFRFKEKAMDAFEPTGLNPQHHAVLSLLENGGSHERAG